ncbi:MAG: MMPL family transporter [Acidimicrobiales bacterium]|nr:MMPL family transporter [Acidimicrobiales bacterium]
MTASPRTGLDSPPSTPGAESQDPAPNGKSGEERGAHVGRFSPFARLGTWAATHFRRVLIAWLLVLLVLGFFAVHVESALAGAGWQASNSQSVAARAIIEKNFSGLGATGLQVVVVDHHGPIASDPQAQAIVTKATTILRNDPRVSTVVSPQAGVSLSRDGRTAVLTAGSLADSNKMVKAADAVATPLSALSTSSVSVTLTGDSALWANFNTANRSAMLRSELLSWPVTIIILIIAFGSLVAAGLPLLLTMAGLLVAAGALVITTKFTPVSIWALNFALMFALALGIDYALFLVMRFRSAIKRRGAEAGDRQAIIASVAETVDTAGKAVAFSALTVLASLAAILIVPSPAFRSMAFGIMLSVVAVLAATLTLLPAVLGKIGTNINKGKIRLHRKGHPDGEGALDRMLHSWGKFLWRHPFPAGAAALVLLLLAAAPIIGMRTNMPSITIVPPSANARVGYYQVTSAFGPGAPGELQVVVPEGQQTQALATLAHASGVAGVVPGPTSAGWTLDQVVLTSGPSTTTTGATIDHLRQVLPTGTLIGGAAAENHDLQQTLASHTPLVLGILGVFGFLLLLIALGAPLIAAMGVLITALSVAGAFGIGRLIFQSGLLAGPLGFQPQGFIDAWAPLFFGAMVFGVAMDYTLFLLSAAKERYETHPDPEHAMIGSMRTSGRVVLSAAAVMVAVFLTFALSGPLAPKEMGVILAIAVGLDALVVRLVVLPVVLRLGRHHSWHQPKWLGRILPKVRFSH